VLRAIVQKDPWLAKLLKTRELEAVAPRPGSGGAVRRTRQHRGPGRGRDGTVDIPAAGSVPPEDRDIHRAKSPTLRLRHLLKQSLPPLLRHLLTQPPLLLRLCRVFPLIPQSHTDPSKLQLGDLGIPAAQMRRNRPTRLAPYHTTNLNSRRTLPPDV